MDRFRLLLLIVVAGFAGTAEAASPVRIPMAQPTELVTGQLPVPVLGDESVRRIELMVNGVLLAGQDGRSVVFTVPVGQYIRRLRLRAIGYDVTGAVVGQDEIVINDPQPPLRVRLEAPKDLPAEGDAALRAEVTAPPGLALEGVEFFLDEQTLGIDGQPPYEVRFDAGLFDRPAYARAVLRAASGAEANDVRFFGSQPADQYDVVLHQLPLSVAGQTSGVPLSVDELTLLDNGEPRKIESLIPASGQPLHLILLIDSSESMDAELPLVRTAAREFARSVLRKNDQIAVVGFHQRRFWLTGFTSNLEAIDAAVENLEARGRTHLYDAVIQMLFELQKKPGRRALVVLSDGVNQGGEFDLDHVVHYARYSGVPVYPIIRNPLLSRFMRFGIRVFEANRFAKIAEESGATYFIIRDPRELSGVYAAIAAELRQQYLLGFYATDSGSDRWHAVSVETTRPGLAVRVPRGYFP